MRTIFEIVKQIENNLLKDNKAEIEFSTLDEKRVVSFRFATKSEAEQFVESLTTLDITTKSILIQQLICQKNVEKWDVTLTESDLYLLDNTMLENRQLEEPTQSSESNTDCQQETLAIAGRLLQQKHEKLRRYEAENAILRKKLESKTLFLKLLEQVETMRFVLSRLELREHALHEKLLQELQKEQPSMVGSLRMLSMFTQVSDDNKSKQKCEHHSLEIK